MELTWLDIGFLVVVFILTLFWLTCHLYGLYLSIKNGWLKGAAALAIPGYATVIGFLGLFTKERE